MKCEQCNGKNFDWAKRCDHCGHNFSNHKASPDSSAPAARILTSTGTPISLTAATPAQIEMLRICWPFGLKEWPESRGKFGLVCQLPSRDIMAVKFQQVDVPPATAHLVRFQNRCLIALALRGYLARGHRGFIMPCAYAKPKSDGRVETGIAYLVGPHPTAVSVAGALSEQGWDADMGAGATALIADFAREVGRVIDQAPQGTSGAGVTLGRPVFLTMELRPASTLGFLDPRVAVLGPDVLVTAQNPGGTLDGAWDVVARSGLTTLSHAPLVPVQLQEEGSVRVL